jgi:hypothetical protein
MIPKPAMIVGIGMLQESVGLRNPQSASVKNSVTLKNFAIFV